ncbi:MAG: lytic transglycosylase domain-containing protein [Verrucomicrobia bacterium]|nr:lytic transglycosylase domain-containing protein [Verrucomicrobiota bacterium]
MSLSKKIIILGFILLFVFDAFVFYSWRRYRVENAYNESINHASKKYGISGALIKAIIWRESRFDRFAAGADGEVGLMQIRKLAATDWADAEGIEPFSMELLWNSDTNVLAGTWYVSMLSRRYTGTDFPLPYILADYNAGRRNVLRWIKGDARTNYAAFLKNIDFPGTRDYIDKVINRYKVYLQEDY